MEIDVPNKIIEQMVKNQVDISIRKRIKEMQGDYTSKGYIENVIRDIIWDKITKLCPNVENYIKEEIERCVDITLNTNGTFEFTKKQLVEQVVNNLLERF